MVIVTITDDQTGEEISREYDWREEHTSDPLFIGEHVVDMIKSINPDKELQ